MAVHTWAVMENGQCINIIELDPNDCGQYHQMLPTGQTLINIHALRQGNSVKPGIGWSFDGTNWTASTNVVPH